MKLKHFIYFLLLMFLGACEKEQLSPSEETGFYTLPQGNQAYDQRIVDFHSQYGTYILYKYTSVDFRWNFTDNILFHAELANPAYVGASLDFLQMQLFDYYEPAFLKKVLPFKILLASHIFDIKNDGNNEVLDTEAEVAWSHSHFAFGYAGEQLDTLSESRRLSAKGSLHGALWASALLGNRIQLPKEFLGSIVYTRVTIANYKQLGMFRYGRDGLPDRYGITVYGDLYDYIYRLTSYTEDEIESKFLGLENDPTGIYRKRFEALVDFFKQTYNIDLHAIGKAKLNGIN